MNENEGARPSFFKRAWSFIVELWEVLIRPSSVFGLGVLVLAGFAAGVIFWGGFNTALELTNTEKFCTSSLLKNHELGVFSFLPVVVLGRRGGVGSNFLAWCWVYPDAG
jgi:NapC/NirT cytochrome c family, N-terminal region